MEAEGKIGVIGAHSMVGSRFCELSNPANLVLADLKGEISVDITQKKSVDQFFQNHSFGLVVLFSAFTDVDAAEKQRDDKSASCWQINVEGVKNIAVACLNSKKKLILISTDFVFDGTSGPYLEEDPVGPDLTKVSWYGITKMEAEEQIQKILEDFLIIRIAYPYRSRFGAKDDIAKRILRMYQQGNLYPMFADQTITPTFIDDVQPAINTLLSQDQNGIFHVASPTVTTQYEFAQKLIDTFGGDLLKVEKGSVVEFSERPNSTPRPISGGLKVERIKELGFVPTDWEKGIETIYEQSKGELI